LQCKADGVIGGGIAGMQRGDHVDPFRQGVETIDSSTVRLRNDMRSNSSRAASSRDFSTSSGARFDAEDMAALAVLEKQVVQDEAEIGLAGAMIGQRQIAIGTMTSSSNGSMK
jgi:hypothetical protein